MPNKKSRKRDCEAGKEEKQIQNIGSWPQCLKKITPGRCLRRSHFLRNMAGEGQELHLLHAPSPVCYYPQSGPTAPRVWVLLPEPQGSHKGWQFLHGSLEEEAPEALPSPSKSLDQGGLDNR